MTLRARFALVAGGAVTCSVALLSIVMYFAERQDLLRRADADLQREAASLSSIVLDGRVNPRIDADQVRHYDLLAQVVAADGRITPLQGSATMLPVSDRVLDVITGRQDRFVSEAMLDGRDYRILTVPAPAGALMVARSTDDVAEHLVTFAVSLCLVVIAGLGVAVLLGELVAKAALRSITRLSAAAEDIAAGRTLRSRLQITGQDELARLTSIINSMLDTLDQARRSQNQLVADASHELRTPLTSIRTNVEVMEDERRLTDDDRRRLRADTHSEVLGLITAVDDLLDLARDEKTNESVDEVALDLLIADVVESVRRRWPETTIEYSARPKVVIGDRTQLQRAFANLVDNAAKWSPPGRPVEVSLTQDAVNVRDHGPGIPGDELPHVFERFYRATTARGLPGAGLGLAIVMRVVDEHGWQVRAENHPDGGAVFRVELPAVPAAGARPGAVAPSTATGPGAAGRRGLAGLPLRPLIGAAATALTLAAIVVLFVVHDGLPGSDAPVPLVSLTGVLSECGGQHCVEGAVVDFGPSWYVRGTRAPYDFDGDGTRRLMEAEIAGLEGTRVRLETDGGALDQDVYTINGLPYRDFHGQLPAPVGTPR